MTAPTLESELSPMQRSVVELPWDARALVTAGAGAGKTTTLTHRLEHLTGAEELEAAEILVLSFSRASVRELRDRVDRHAVSARRVRAQTFDGWALSLLLQADPGREDLVGTSFDARIEMATKAIEAGVIDESEHGIPAHVVIDEVQDLVGVRRDMVESLLDRFSDQCGFTVVGDAAQSIYGFQVADPEARAGEVNRFFDWVRNSFPDAVEVTLADNFRARTTQARVALPYGARLQNLPADPAEAAEEAERIHSDLRSELALAPDFGSLDDPFVQDSLRHFDGTTAILCRDNGQVLRLSELLWSHGLSHRVQRSPRSRPNPAWLAGLLNATEATTLTEDRFTDILGTTALRPDTAPERLWRSLRRAAAGPRNTLDVDALHRAAAAHLLPDELTAPTPHPLVLSTIHRAKGLEFDRVLIVEPQALSERHHADDDPPAEARLLYVAMTRPRDDLFRLTRPDTSLVRRHKPTDRWYLGGRRSYIRNGVGVGDADVCHEVPAGIREPFTDPGETQRYLEESVRPDVAVELRRLHDLPFSPEETPPYGIFHEGGPIGQVSEHFRRDLWRLLKIGGGWKVERWPSRITGLRVDALETVAAPAAHGDREAWLAPRLCGLGRFDWTNADSLPEGSSTP